MRLLFLALLIPLSGCTPSLRSELEQIRAEIKRLEAEQRRIPEGAPMWIDKNVCIARTDLTEEDAFENNMQDHTPTIPDYIYNHVMGRLGETSLEVIEKMSAGDFPIEQALENPGQFRGKVWRISGVAVNLRLEKLKDAPIKEAFSGAAYTIDNKLFLFHIVEQPDPIDVGRDTIEIFGVFVKLISVGQGDDRRSAPLFFARALKKFL